MQNVGHVLRAVRSAFESSDIFSRTCSVEMKQDGQLSKTQPG